MFNLSNETMLIAGIVNFTIVTFLLTILGV